MNEIGRELSIGELKPKTVVIVSREDRSVYATFWVRSITPHYVEFYSGITHVHFLARRLPDGSLQDDTGHHIHVHEYLGEI